MRLTLVTGGARAGKSRYAQDLAFRLGQEAVTYVATARVTDDEMRRRIERHRAERPASWVTREAPDDADAAIRAATTPVVLLDCLTVFLANALDRARPEGEVATLDAMARGTGKLIEAIESRGSGDLIIVTNEVGWGVHPETALGRWYRDGLGSANQRLAASAAEVVLVVAGVPVVIKRAGT